MREFDIEHRHKCPKCRKNMEFVYGNLLCTECGYKMAFGENKKAAVANHKVEQSMAESVREKPMPKEQAVVQKKLRNESKPKKKKYTEIILFVGILLFIAVCYVVSSKIDFKKNKFSYLVNTQSEGMVSFVEHVYGCPYDEVSQEQLDQMKYIDIREKDGQINIYYQLKYGESYLDYEECELEMDKLSFENSDFSIFDNLGTLYIRYGSIGSLEGLDKLCVLGSELTPKEIRELIDPSQFISLTLYDLTSVRDLDTLWYFRELSSLYMYLDNSNIKDIDVLANLDELRNVGIYGGDKVKEFGTLEEMSKLERLSIDCSTLEELDFLENMSELRSLTIRDCALIEVSEWEKITKAEGLETLRLENCYIPYTVDKFIGMQNLEELEITDCVIGMNVEEIPVNNVINSLNLYGTTIYKLQDGTWDENSNKVVISEYFQELYEKCRNLQEIYY